MSVESFIRREWDKKGLLSTILFPASVLVSYIARVRRKKYRRNCHRSYHSSLWVISIGNLSVGGNGKTPFTIALARYLQSIHKQVAVSHRGYKGDFEYDTCLISTQKSLLPAADRAGDEAYLLAKNLSGIPVIVGKNRQSALEHLSSKTTVDTVILDDSFQHLSVAHDCDVVVFSASNPLGNHRVIPSGKLRESLDALIDADVLVFSDCPHDFSIPFWAQQTGLPIILTTYIIENLVSFKDRSALAATAIKDMPVILISGIGTPASFEQSIEKMGARIVQHAVFPDHHDYNYERDIRPILNMFTTSSAKIIITTEKDYSKLRFFSRCDTFYFAQLDLKIEPKLDTLRSFFLPSINPTKK